MQCESMVSNKPSTWQASLSKDKLGRDSINPFLFGIATLRKCLKVLPYINYEEFIFKIHS